MHFPFPRTSYAFSSNGARYNFNIRRQKSEEATPDFETRWLKPNVFNINEKIKLAV